MKPMLVEQYTGTPWLSAACGLLLPLLFGVAGGVGRKKPCWSRSPMQNSV